MANITGRLEAYRRRALNTNVNDITLLATDYLNHFNEALMLAELVVDMPEMLDDFMLWMPVSYADHFRASAIADKDLAIEAYDYSPCEYRDVFEATVRELDLEILGLQQQFADAAEGDELDMALQLGADRCRYIRHLIDRAGSIINGHITAGSLANTEVALDQEKIDALFD